MGVQSPGPTPHIGLLLQPAVTNSALMWPPSVALLFESDPEIPADVITRRHSTSVFTLRASSSVFTLRRSQS